MEEEIKILENFIQYNKFCKEENGKLTITIDLDVKTTLDKTIQNLLTRYKQLEEKENNKFKKIIEYEKTLEKLQKETIWKSKVKEKIEEVRGLKFKDERLDRVTIDFAVNKFEDLLGKE